MDADGDAVHAALHAASDAPASALLAGVPARLVVAALLTLVLAAALARLLLSRGPSRRRDALLLVGASGGGKTALFSRLVDGAAFAATTPSMAENVAVLPLGHAGARLRVVDLPGHHRLRSRLDAYAPCAKGIVFVVDGREGAFLPVVRDVAQVFLDVLTHAALARRPPPVLLAVNKTDKSGCHSVEFVRKRVEKEIDALRAVRGTLEDTSGEGDAAAAMAPVLQCPSPFSFAGAGVRMTCTGVSVLRNDVAPVTSFAATLR